MKGETAQQIGKAVGAGMSVFWGHLEKSVRHWEQRPLARRKREVLAGMVCIALCLIGKFTYEMQGLGRIRLPVVVNTTKALPEPSFSEALSSRIRGDSVARRMYLQSLEDRKHSKTKIEPDGSH